MSEFLTAIGYGGIGLVLVGVLLRVLEVWDARHHASQGFPLSRQAVRVEDRR